MWALKLMFAGLLQEALTFGIGALLVAALVAGGFFLPFVWAKKVCLSLAALIVVGLLAYGTGVQHEYDRGKARERVLVEQATKAARDAADAVKEIFVPRDCAPAAPAGRVRHKPLDRDDRSGR